MIKLELLNENDFSKILEWNKNKDADFLLQWSGPLYKYPLSLEQIKTYFRNTVENEDSKIFVYKIILDKSQEIVGTVELRETDKENKGGRVCRFLIGNESVRGKGIGAIALKKIIKIGFQDLNLEKISLGVFDFNEGAIKCYEKVGFKKEKLIVNSSKASDGYWNLYEMSILRSK